MAQTKTRDVPPATLAEVEEQLAGIEYPKSRDELVAFAKDRAAPAAVVSLLKRLPERQYADAAEVADGVAAASSAAPVSAAK